MLLLGHAPWELQERHGARSTESRSRSTRLGRLFNSLRGRFAACGRDGERFGRHQVWALCRNVRGGVLLAFLPVGVCKEGGAGFPTCKVPDRREKQTRAARDRHEGCTRTSGKGQG